MLTRQHRQEGLSRAYVQAIAAQCGMSCGTSQPDYGTDLTLNEIEALGAGWSESGFKVDVQAKSTTRAQVGPTDVRYDLEVKAYDHLRDVRAWNPRILVVLVLPEDEAEWLNQTEEELSLHRCAYWLSLRGREPVRRRKTVRLFIPRTNVFSVEALRSMITAFKGERRP